MLKRLPVVALTLALSGCVRCGSNVEAKAKEKLHALAYFATSPAEDEEAGVVVNETAKVQPGVTIWIDHPKGVVELMDLGGKILASYDMKKLMAAYDPTHPDKKFFEERAHELLLAKPYQDDSYLLLYENRGLVRMNLDGTIRWLRKDNFHHDFLIESDGKIWALALRERSDKSYTTEMPILDNCITEVSPDGVVGQELCLLDMFEKIPEIKDAIIKQPEYFHYYEEDAWDALHTNSITRATEEIVDANGKKIVEPGDFLLCLRHTDMIFVIDPVEKAVRWYWGHGQLEYPHDASFVEGGRILLFDNGTRRGWSRVIEVDPRDGQIKWEFHGEPKESFLTKSRGAVQRLANGNTLVTVAKGGHIIELTKDKQIVWHFKGPTMKTEKGLVRVALYRTYRLDKLPGAKD